MFRKLFIISNYQHYKFLESHSFHLRQYHETPSALCLPPHRNPIIITSACAKRIHHVNQNRKRYLRVYVADGGCSGFQSTFSFCETLEPNSDYIFTRDEASVVVDKDSFDLIEGATIDYVEALAGSKFQIDRNPLAQTTCSCGSSFGLKQKEE